MYVTRGLILLFFVENIFIFGILHGLINSEEVILTSVTATSIFNVCLTKKVSLPFARLLRMYSTFLYAGHGLLITVWNHVLKLSDFQLFGGVIVTSIPCFVVWLYLSKVIGPKIKFLKYMA